MNTFDSFSFSATLTPESANAMADLWKVDPDKVVSTSFYVTKYVQNRKHKKYRINKKWAKRYGVKPITYKYDNVKIDVQNID